jgi:hypothetical protein
MKATRRMCRDLSNLNDFNSPRTTAWTDCCAMQNLHSPHPCGLCRRYDSTDGGGRAIHGAIAESTNSRRFMTAWMQEAMQEQLPRNEGHDFLSGEV